jgi:hypothetical protein
MAHNTAKLGGAASDVVVGKVAVSRAVQPNGFLSQTFYSWRLARRTQHGLMMMTWKPTPVPDEEAFAAIKAGIDALPPGAKMFLNSGECGALGHHHLDVTPEYCELTRPLFFFCFRRVLRARREHSESRVGRALLREIPWIRRPRVPLR